MDYHDKRRAKANLAQALEQRGWKLYGWHEDRSDSMTDYYHPESWDGIAEKEGAIVCVDISAYDVNSKSGQAEERYVPQQGPPCDRCDATGVEPNGWTLTQAREEPSEFHLDQLMREHEGQEFTVLDDRSGIRFFGGNTMRAGLSGGVSPLHFTDRGEMKCVKCHGSGKLAARPKVEVAFTWPAFHANPPHKTWHIEVEGQIVASGVGLKKAYGNSYGDMEGAHELAAKLDCARHGRSSGGEGDDSVSAAEGNGVRLVHNVAKNGLELYFTAKPSLEVRDRIKRHGWRWARRNACWYVRKSESQEAFAQALVEQFGGTAAV